MVRRHVLPQRLLALGAVPGGIHHCVVVVRDLGASLRFYRDGLGLDLLLDRHVESDWPDLFDAPSRACARFFLATRGFRTITPVSWSSRCSM
jgi:catechol 2,3-dioxygenase-like lactoylglutathione lyase family enzyme